MTLNKAIKLVTAEYKRAKTKEYIEKPLAFALYKVWRLADTEPVKVKNKESEGVQNEQRPKKSNRRGD